MTAPATQFRKWLIVQLQRTRWVRRNEPVEVTAERLGVTPSVLEEARRQYAENGGKLGFRIIAESTMVEIRAPKAVYDEWMRRCKGLRLEPGSVFTTLIHRLLLSKQNPAHLGERCWIVHGVAHEVKASDRKAWPWRMRARVSRGAKSALRIRADRLRTTETALVRGAVIEFLEGSVTRLPRIVSSDQMHASVDKYFLGEKK